MLDPTTFPRSKTRGWLAARRRRASRGRAWDVSTFASAWREAAEGGAIVMDICRLKMGPNISIKTQGRPAPVLGRPLEGLVDLLRANPVRRDSRRLLHDALVGRDILLDGRYRLQLLGPWPAIPGRSSRLLHV